MTKFTQDTEYTPVLFRMARAAKRDGSDVTAVFPCEPGTYDGNTMTCYAHMGQHGSCDFGWYYTTRPATETEYADLKAELESAPYGYKLKIYRRMHHTLREKFRKELRRIQRANGKESTP